MEHWCMVVSLCPPPPSKRSHLEMSKFDRTWLAHSRNVIVFSRHNVIFEDEPAASALQKLLSARRPDVCQITGKPKRYVQRLGHVYEMCTKPRLFELMSIGWKASTNQSHKSEGGRGRERNKEKQREGGERADVSERKISTPTVRGRVLETAESDSKKKRLLPLPVNKGICEVCGGDVWFTSEFVCSKRKVIYGSTITVVEKREQSDFVGSVYVENRLM